MRLATLLAILLAGPAGADCAAEVAGLYRGGALDPATRPNRIETTAFHWPDGTIEPVSTVIHSGPGRTIACDDSGCVLSADGGVWRGATPDGPWHWQGVGQRVAEAAAYARRLADGFAENISKARCEDTLVNGRPARLYSYHARSQPGIATWSAGDYRVWVDAQTGWVVRIEEAGAMRAVAPDPRVQTWVTTIVNDPEIVVSVPVD